jgi:hypothetical protein
MPAIHRDTDPRSCGATTVVGHQSTVFANGLLVSVNGDDNTDGDGALIAQCKNVFAEGIMVVNNTPDESNSDADCPIPGGEHCNPKTAGGSPDVFVGD